MIINPFILGVVAPPPTLQDLIVQKAGAGGFTLSSGGEGNIHTTNSDNSTGYMDKYIPNGGVDISGNMSLIGFQFKYVGPTQRVMVGLSQQLASVTDPVVGDYNSAYFVIGLFVSGGNFYRIDGAASPIFLEVAVTGTYYRLVFETSLFTPTKKHIQKSTDGTTWTDVYEYVSGLDDTKKYFLLMQGFETGNQMHYLKGIRLSTW